MDVADGYVTFVRHSQDMLREKVNEEVYIERLFDVSKPRAPPAPSEADLVTTRFHFFTPPVIIGKRRLKQIPAREEPKSNHHTDFIFNVHVSFDQGATLPQFVPLSFSDSFERKILVRDVRISLIILVKPIKL